jgi:hypothetical protein
VALYVVGQPGTTPGDGERMSGSIRWIRPPSELARAVEQYGDRALVAVAAVADRIAKEMQNDARGSAPWMDRSSNARGGLFATVETDFAAQMVTIFLSHGADIDYGVYLELANGGRYQVIMPTIERHLPELMADLRQVFA